MSNNFTFEARASAASLALPDFAVSVFRWVLSWLMQLLRDKTPDSIDRALDIIEPILLEMLTAGRDQGLGRLSVAFRRPYEERIAYALRLAGLLESV